MKVVISKSFLIIILSVFSNFIPNLSLAGKSGAFKRTHLETVDSTIKYSHKTVKNSKSRKLRVFTANTQTKGIESINAKEVWVSPPDVNIYATYSIPLNNTIQNTITTENTIVNPVNNSNSIANTITPVNNYVIYETKSVITANNPVIKEELLDKSKQKINMVKSETKSVRTVNKPIIQGDFRDKSKQKISMVKSQKKPLTPPNNSIIGMDNSTDLVKSTIGTDPNPKPRLYFIPGTNSWRSDDMALRRILLATVAQVIEEECNLKPEIKVPKDIFLNEKKVCGVSVFKDFIPSTNKDELENSPTFFASIFLNVNVMDDDIFSLIDQPATSMARESGRYFDRDNVLQLISEKLFLNLENQDTFKNTIKPYLNSHSISLKLAQTIIERRILSREEKLTSLPTEKESDLEQEVLVLENLVWKLREETNSKAPLHPSLMKERLVQMMFNKFEQDAHFQSIVFPLEKVPHIDGRGLSWASKKNGHYVSFRMGENESSHPTAQGLHVKIQAYGKIIDKMGKFHSEDELAQNTQLVEDCHISLTDWLRWPLWLAPRLPVDVRKLEEDFLQKQQAKIIAEQQTGIAIESLPIHSSPSIPLVTPVHQEVSSKDQGFQMPEEEKAHLEAFPVSEQQLPSIFGTPIQERGVSILAQHADNSQNVAIAQKLKEDLAIEQQAREVGTIIFQGGSQGLKEFRKANIYVEQHGGNLEDWVKKTSSSFEKSNGSLIETHWVENLKTGEKYDYKIKEIYPNKAKTNQ